MTDPTPSPSPPASSGFSVDVNDPIIKPIVTGVAALIVGACGFLIKQGLLSATQAGMLATVLAPVVVGGGVIVWRMLVAHSTGKKLVTVAVDPRVPPSVAKLK